MRLLLPNKNMGWMVLWGPCHLQPETETSNEKLGLSWAVRSALTTALRSYLKSCKLMGCPGLSLRYLMPGLYGWGLGSCIFKAPEMILTCNQACFLVSLKILELVLQSITDCETEKKRITVLGWLKIGLCSCLEEATCPDSSFPPLAFSLTIGNRPSTRHTVGRIL